ncbi:type 1 fimbrial protein [Vibrio sp. VGrn 2]|uniref:fimbrial protein n=1 Tax=Vibrio sp. VGrn 2 TaxID=2419839 RepID=UPI00128BD780|nr:fimbrial protein [Vibrio sp. VGrn 2]MPS41563.1 type 1 fimbrial protein [Vibrio sp. VGrn 2]
MKKLNILTLAFASVLSSSAFANTGTVNFYGAISHATCEFIAEENGAQTNNVDLGTWTVANLVGNTTAAVDFALVAKDPDTGEACTTTGATDVDITWLPVTGAWDAFGLQNTGSAQGAAVKLMDKDGASFNTDNSTVTHSLTTLTDGRLPFSAQIVKTAAPVVAGTVVASASFTVAYK